MLIIYHCYLPVSNQKNETVFHTAYSLTIIQEKIHFFPKVKKSLYNRAHSSSNMQPRISCLFEDVFLDYLEESDVISPAEP